MKKRVEEILAPLDQIPLECDGFCRCASYLLTKYGVEHEVWTGTAFFHDEEILPGLHYWIRVDDLWVDYRLRMWFGPDAPHGVHETKPVGMEYKGHPVSGFAANEMIYKILTGGML